MRVPELHDNFDANITDTLDDQLRYTFAVGPLHAATAEELAAVVDGSRELWLESVGSSDRTNALAADYAVLADPDTTAETRAEITDRLDPSGEHYIPALLGHLALRPESVFLLRGEDPDAMYEQRETANKAMLQYFEACKLLLPHSALRVLAQQAWSLDAQATAAMDRAMVAQLLERGQNASGSIGVVTATAHHAVPQLVADAGHPVSRTVVGSGRLPYSSDYGQRLVSLQESGQTGRPTPEFEELQDRTLLTDLYYTSGLLVSPQNADQGPTAYDYHLAREAAQSHVETMTAADVHDMLTILSNLNTAIGGLDEYDRGHGGISRPRIVAAGRELIDAALKRWPLPADETP